MYRPCYNKVCEDKSRKLLQRTFEEDVRRYLLLTYQTIIPQACIGYGMVIIITPQKIMHMLGIFEEHSIVAYNPWWLKP